MKFSTAGLILSAVTYIAASPVPAIEWVTELNTVTVTVKPGQASQTAQATETTQAAQATQATQETQATQAPQAPQAPQAETAAAQQSEEATPTEVAQSTSQAAAAVEAPQQTSSFSTAPVETSSEPAPEPSTTTPSTSSSTSASTTSSDSASSSEPTGSVQSGEGTYYDPEMGSCGEVSSADDLIVALSHSLYDDYTPNGNPNKNTLCGKKIRATYEGKSVDVKVVDRCVGCAKDDLDLSPAAFSKIADKDLGRIHLTWKWLD